MRKMVELSQCYSGTGIRGWGKVCSGRKESCQEKNCVDVADDQQIVAPRLLVVSAVRLGKRYFIFIDALDHPPHPPQPPTRDPRATARNRSNVTKHPSTPYRKTTFDHNIMRGFNEAVRMSASPTHLGNIGIYLEMRLGGGTEPDAMAIHFHSDCGIW